MSTWAAPSALPGGPPKDSWQSAAKSLDKRSSRGLAVSLLLTSLMVLAACSSPQCRSDRGSPGLGCQCWASHVSAILARGRKCRVRVLERRHHCFAGWSYRAGQLANQAGGHAEFRRRVGWALCRCHFYSQRTDHAGCRARSMALPLAVAQLHASLGSWGAGFCVGRRSICVCL
jgi:hypothetical protein